VSGRLAVVRVVLVVPVVDHPMAVEAAQAVVVQAVRVPGVGALAARVLGDSAVPQLALVPAASAVRVRADSEVVVASAIAAGLPSHRQLPKKTLAASGTATKTKSASAFATKTTTIRPSQNLLEASEPSES
jgi:hypothetical protein